MTALHDFNHQRYEDALARILPCVAIPAWAEALEGRLKNTDAQEVQAALEQLREITLLRLEGVIGE